MPGRLVACFLEVANQLVSADVLYRRAFSDMKSSGQFGSRSTDSVFRCGRSDTLYSVTQFVKSRALQMFALGHGGYCEDVSMGQ